MQEQQAQNPAMNAALWDSRYSARDREVLKVVSTQYGLDPLAREVIMIDGSVYVTASGLQRLAVRDPNYDGCEIEIVEADWKANFFVVKARIWKKGCARPFEDFGDADPSTSRLKGHDLFRHAITRARARAMRSAFAIPFCSLEELNDEVRMRVPQRREATKRPRQWHGKNQQNTNNKHRTQRPELASAQQHNAILRMAAEVGLNSEDLLPEIREHFNVSSWELLTREQARTLLRELEGRLIEDLAQKQQKGDVTPKHPVKNEASSPRLPSLDLAAISEDEAPSRKKVRERLRQSQEQTAPVQSRRTKPIAEEEEENIASLPPSLQKRRAEQLIHRMKSAQNLNQLRKEWESFRAIQKQLSAQWVQQICALKNKRKDDLLAA